ncbi:allene oxide synthase 1, chloroplastic-like protein [Cinnamomum micranthum f. kanehirae]|uniref:Allene oxide synthase 1, chloroplastic-like protein n=1 Tax=Cinnamomum micranthum f. kanehirae TaxID=337451 RepID=A0A3S4NHF1_9MAGN|nr:allene oxide synthase 1, chloroplastic-like protein [Cinnamomum micranthum f. kanehirae]
MSSSASSNQQIQPADDDDATTKLPIQQIPGGYGIPFIGAIKDRLDYYYNQGRDNYFRTRMTKFGSTVFRANMPPGPFMARNPRVVVLLDAASFPVLFDVSKVEKRDVFTGTYMPSTSLSGGYRALAYLDPSEPKHALLKQLLFFLLSTRKQAFIPEFHTSFTTLFDTLESDIAKDGKSDFNSRNDTGSFSFLAGAYFGVNPSDTGLGSDGPTIASKWLLFQLHP